MATAKTAPAKQMDLYAGEVPPKLADLQAVATFDVGAYDADRILNTPFKQSSEYAIVGDTVYIATLDACGNPKLDIKAI